MAITETTESNIPLNEEQLEKKVGDLTERLRLASEAKFYDSVVNWGPITIGPGRNVYRVFGIDGILQEEIPRTNYEVEQLVDQFDAALKTALSEL